MLSKGLESGIEKPITLTLSVSICVRKLLKHFYQFKILVIFANWPRMDGRTDLQVDYRAHSEISL